MAKQRVPRASQSPVVVTVGERFPLTIKKLGVEGQGIGYFKHKVCFVPGALPGEVIVAEVTAVHERYLTAKIHRLKQASSARVTPKDVVAGIAGGFELEHLAYPAQLKFKRQMVLDSLAKFKPRGYRHYQVRPTLPSPQEYGYRNKAQFQVRQVDGHVVAGLYQAHSHTVVDLAECAVQMPLTMQVVRALVAMIEELQIPPYEESNHSGIIKTLAVRETTTGEVQVTLITNTPKLLKKHQLLTRIKAELPAVKSVMQNINPGDTPLVWGEETRLLAGESYGPGFSAFRPVIFAAQSVADRSLV